MKYFPKPTFVSIDEDGGITLEYVQKDRRLCICVDVENKRGDDLAVYYIVTSEDGQVCENLAKNEEIVALLRDRMGLVAE